MYVQLRGGNEVVTVLLACGGKVGCFLGLSGAVFYPLSIYIFPLLGGNYTKGVTAPAQNRLGISSCCSSFGRGAHRS